MKVDFYRHPLDRSAADAVGEVLASGFLTTGRVSAAVEAQLCQYFDVPHAILTSSWTSGAMAALMAMGVGPGDEVVVPAMTFVATANIAELLGASAVLVDVDPETLLMTPQAVAAAITERTRAVIPVHLYGQMCDIAGIRAMVDAAERAGGRRIYLVEDCAHCFEGTRDGERPGRHSDIAAFSFYATKNVTCGEGGAVIFRDSDLYRLTLETRLHGMTAAAVDRFAGGRYNHWDSERVGLKANLPDLLAALLPQQIRTIDARLGERHELVERYRNALAGGPVRLVADDPACRSAHHLFTIGVPGPDRDLAIARLNEAGIGITVNYRALPDLAYYGRRYPQARARCPQAVLWGRQTLSLPLFPGLTRAEQDHVIESVQRHVYPLAGAP